MWVSYSSVKFSKVFFISWIKDVLNIVDYHNWET